MVVLTIPDGILRGKIQINSRGGLFISFQGIPYAAPPIGSLRFKAPIPVNPWSGIKDATKEGPRSVSMNVVTRKVVGSEDCLNLNVYTPKLPRKDKDEIPKPVMVFIHGGMFVTGSNSTDLHGPEFLIAEDIILVTINYRLGLLGFLSLDDASLGVPGNAGFKDMVMALKWVKNNIASFGGDPGNVTIFGESTGGAAVHMLVLSPMAKGLFHKAIMQSGSALNQWVYGRRCAGKIAQQLGISSSNDRKILDFFQDTPAADFVTALEAVDGADIEQTTSRFVGLVLERHCKEEEAFLTRRPIDLILSGEYNHVPMIMGYNKGEGMVVDSTAPKKTKNIFFNNLEVAIPSCLNVEPGSSTSRAIAERIRSFYYGNIQHTREKNMAQYYKLCTDTFFFRDIFYSARSHIATLKCPLYFYRFSLESELNIFKKISKITLPGVFHGDDLGYLFKTNFTPNLQPGSIEDVWQRRFTKMWTNFAKYGDPTPMNDELDIWKPVDCNQFNFLDIDHDTTMNIDPESQAVDFWDDIFKINPIISKL